MTESGGVVEDTESMVTEGVGTVSSAMVGVVSRLFYGMAGVRIPLL